MKIADVAWGWTPIPEDTPEGDSLIRIADQIRALGFEGVDYLATPEGLDQFYNEANSKKLGEHSRSIGLEPNVFVFQAADWNKADAAVRKKNLDYFEKCAKVAEWVGCKIISGLSPLACGAAGWRFKASAPAQKQSYNLPSDYDFKADWARLVDGYKSALAIAKRHGLRMSIECFPMSMVSTPHAMLKVLEDVGDPDFGIQLDTNHLVAQHIDPEWTIRILGGKSLFNIHCKDNDAVSRGNIPAGAGIVDYTAVIGALKDVGYKGNLTVELEFTDNPRRYNKQALDHLKLCLAGEY
ncbi:MAG: sugar phosphate isomerase/epimerase [Clostridiales bacterium]|jgi:sugar phosphate isomerase/epimerase|nr:sugar phosphate isomerase/epimerase [Clostridiales bacterium]